MRIDAHLHFWKPSCGFDNRPVADNAAYRRDFMPADVAPDLDAAGIDGAIVVQTAPQTAETDWLIDVTANEGRIYGLTGWVDLAGGECDYGALLACPKVVGIRAQLRRIADDAFVAKPDVISNLDAALRSGLSVTILAEARHYRHLRDVLPRLADGPVIINHLGLPFPDVDRDAWRATLRAFAARPQTYVQLSGLPFLYGPRWRDGDARSLLDDAFALLGPQRLMFASDYPMLLRFATYGEWVEYVEAFVAAQRLSAADVEAIFSGNALRAHPRLRVGSLNASAPAR
jgi:L-fuconolactonase